MLNGISTSSGGMVNVEPADMATDERRSGLGVTAPFRIFQSQWASSDLGSPEYELRVNVGSSFVLLSPCRTSPVDQNLF